MNAEKFYFLSWKGGRLMKRGLIQAMVVVFALMMVTSAFAQGQVEVGDIEAKKLQDADAFGYIVYELTADVKNHADVAHEVAVSVRGISERGGGGTAYLYGRIPAKSQKYLSFKGRMLQNDWNTIQDWEVESVSAH